MADPTDRPLVDVLDDLDASDAEIAARDIVAGETVLSDLEARLEARSQQPTGNDAADIPMRF